MSAQAGTTLAIDTPARGRRLPLSWLRNRSFAAGVGVLGVVMLLALMAPLLTPYDPIAQNLSRILLPPSAEHPLGTDHLGRDVWPMT